MLYDFNSNLIPYAFNGEITFSYSFQQYTTDKKKKKSNPMI